MTNLVGIGLDIGSQKTIIVAEDGEIIRTSTGSVTRPTLISFADKNRLFGEEASAQISSDATIGLLNLMAGRSVSEINSMPCFSHKKVPITADQEGRLLANISFRGEEETISVTALLAMLLVHLNEQVHISYGSNAVFCFPLHPNYSASIARAYKEAALIAGIDESKVFVTDAADALIATYARKIIGLGGAEKNNLIGKNVLLVDMGHTQTTIVAVRYEDNAYPIKVAVAHDENLGSYHFDLILFDHFAQVCQSKYKTKIEPSTKRGVRLLGGCERIRKLLSQLSESQITIEHLIDEGDVNFTLKRDEMYLLCNDLLDRLKGLLRLAIGQLSVSTDGAVVDAVEVVGGGVRMPVVQQAIAQFVGESIPLGAKLDDGSVALGAALLYRRKQNELAAIAAEALKPVSDIVIEASDSTPVSTEAVPMEVDNTHINQAPDGIPEEKEIPSSIVIDEEPSIGLTADEIQSATEKELFYQSKDNEIKELRRSYNKLESFILEMRNAPRRKHGELINQSQLNAILDEYEQWLWDFGSESTSLQIFEEKYHELNERVQSISQEYFNKVNEEKQALEQLLQEEAAKAQQEREENGEDEDHDTRKLKKTDRMRLVVKNKDEGNELFKAGNYRLAAARYHKALTHSSKFFDLGPEDELEVKNLKISLHNNLATCYLKLDNYEQLVNNVKEVLKLDDKNVKALFRYSQYYEYKKEWEKSLEYLNLCQSLNAVEDKLVTKSIEKVKKEISKLKDKEKKMWGKAFA